MTLPEIIKVCRRITKRQQYEEYQGYLIDGCTASAVCLLYDSLNEKNKDKLVSFPIPKLVDTVWKFVEFEGVK